MAWDERGGVAPRLGFVHGRLGTPLPGFGMAQLGPGLGMIGTVSRLRTRTPRSILGMDVEAEDVGVVVALAGPNPHRGWV